MSFFSMLLHMPFQLKNIPFYAILGIVCGFVSLYFNRTNEFLEANFVKIKNITLRLIVGGIGLSLLIYLFPPLFGEGYDITCQYSEWKRNGNGHRESFLFTGTMIYSGTSVFLFLIVIFKVIAVSFTNGCRWCGRCFCSFSFCRRGNGFYDDKNSKWLSHFKPS